MSIPRRGLTVSWNGLTFRPFDSDPEWDARRHPSGGLTIGLRQVLTDGVMKTADGTLVRGADRDRVVRQLSGELDTMPPVFDPTTEEVTRPLIPGLWMHGTSPALSGPKGVGKTTFVCQLAAALLIPGRRFLGLFDPVQGDGSESLGDVVLVNAETRPRAVHDELIRAGLQFAYRDGIPVYYPPEVTGSVLVVEHLMRMGGARAFDLTDSSKLDGWIDRLTSRQVFDRPPLAVIADGVTASLGNNTAGYGAFTSGFRELLATLEIPNGLGVLHSPMGAVGSKAPTPMQGIESMAEWDGIWYYAAASFPVFPSTSRSFFTAPRIGDPIVLTHRVAMSDDGMLSLVSRKAAGADTDADSEEDDAASAEAEVIGRLQEAGSVGLTGLELCPRGREGARLRAARDRMIERAERSGDEPKIFSVSEGRSSRWYLAEYR